MPDIPVHVYRWRAFTGRVRYGPHPPPDWLTRYVDYDIYATNLRRLGLATQALRNIRETTVSQTSANIAQEALDKMEGGDA